MRVSLWINRLAALILTTLLVITTTAIAQDSVTLQIKIPPHCQPHINPAKTIPLDPVNGEYKITVPTVELNTASLTLTDPFGAHKSYPLAPMDPVQKNIIGEDKISTPDANPREINTMPRLCPRLYSNQSSGNTSKFIYDARSDFLNARPTLQLMDPDAHDLPRQRTVLSEFDHKNSLRLKHIRLNYDYEDTAIIDYQGPNPLHPESKQIIHEGEGGFYANFHYAIIPYDPRYLKLSRQETLNLVQGKLANIEREDLTPPVRVHSFLPGPYLSKDGFYSMCEWGDTSHQAPLQELDYQGMILWDWDIQTNDIPMNKIILFVWEGDEEDWLIADGLIDPYYLTDDLVGTFVIEKRDSTKALTLTNAAKNFSITVMTE